ncbi:MULTISPECIES: ABC transporter ATP-binding protein [unclassified Corallococcus]|uniref:ABC transporter ATP-binding protein n=1 Tax=unclassified Corallococcus TaxID=2685029 RepID=UPI001A8FC437|nr:MULTISPECIES: ABC transporter ATP-binding protein [unclassified Corallococcus]MBN9684908.1 ABC transporter ATP-binding protein [Corallococcus sp. NCSPR001]WAS83629.1 ABC transporter ATP-binding protein [Corallococcus sp. NCRR]
MAAIVLEDLVKAYGGTPVVRGLSLHVGQGELVSLLGPSGCGKTTTLRMLAGLEHPDAGSIKLGDEVVAGPGVRVPPEKRGLGMVFQSYAIWPHRSVEANVAYPLALRKVPRHEMASRVREALRWVRLEAYAARMPHELSGGQLQRVALARALVAGPRVLLLDEPLSNLDAALREELRAEIAALRARLGTTLVFVTHDQGEALALSDRIAVMNRGVIEQVDTPERLYREPATPFVAGFVGGANVLRGEVRAGAFYCAGMEASFDLPMDAKPGPGTLVVRPEDLELGETGTPLVLSARLFLGHAAEYRFPVGDAFLRVIGPALEGVRAGQTLRVRVRKATVFDAGA